MNPRQRAHASGSRCLSNLIHDLGPAEVRDHGRAKHSRFYPGPAAAEGPEGKASVLLDYTCAIERLGGGLDQEDYPGRWSLSSLGLWEREHVSGTGRKTKGTGLASVLIDAEAGHVGSMEALGASATSKCKRWGGSSKRMTRRQPANGYRQRVCTLLAVMVGCHGRLAKASVAARRCPCQQCGGYLLRDAATWAAAG